MRFDFSQVQDIESFVSIPEGSYACRVAEVREGLARDGSVRWSLRLEVLDGEYAGRTAGWDGLTWSDRGVLRVQRVLEALGFAVSGEVDIQPTELLGRQVRAAFVAEEREDPLSGRRTVRLRVPYSGYTPLDEDDFLGSPGPAEATC
jgi:hypothetical protein